LKDLKNFDDQEKKQAKDAIENKDILKNTDFIAGVKLEIWSYLLQTWYVSKAENIQDPGIKELIAAFCPDAWLRDLKRWALNKIVSEVDNAKKNNPDLTQEQIKNSLWWLYEWAKTFVTTSYESAQKDNKLNTAQTYNNLGIKLGFWEWKTTETSTSTPEKTPVQTTTTEIKNTNETPIEKTQASTSESMKKNIEDISPERLEKEMDKVRKKMWNSYIIESKEGSNWRVKEFARAVILAEDQWVEDAYKLLNKNLFWSWDNHASKEDFFNNIVYPLQTGWLTNFLVALQDIEATEKKGILNNELFVQVWDKNIFDFFKQYTWKENQPSVDQIYTHLKWFTKEAKTEERQEEKAENKEQKQLNDKLKWVFWETLESIWQTKDISESVITSIQKEYKWNLHIFADWEWNLNESKLNRMVNIFTILEKAWTPFDTGKISVQKRDEYFGKQAEYVEILAATTISKISKLNSDDFDKAMQNNWISFIAQWDELGFLTLYYNWDEEKAIQDLEKSNKDVVEKNLDSDEKVENKLDKTLKKNMKWNIADIAQEFNTSEIILKNIFDEYKKDLHLLADDTWKFDEVKMNRTIAIFSELTEKDIPFATWWLSIKERDTLFAKESISTEINAIAIINDISKESKKVDSNLLGQLLAWEWKNLLRNGKIVEFKNMYQKVQSEQESSQKNSFFWGLFWINKNATNTPTNGETKTHIITKEERRQARREEREERRQAKKEEIKQQEKKQEATQQKQSTETKTTQYKQPETSSYATSSERNSTIESAYRQVDTQSNKVASQNQFDSYSLPSDDDLSEKFGPDVDTKQINEKTNEAMRSGVLSNAVTTILDWLHVPISQESQQTLLDKINWWQDIKADQNEVSLSYESNGQTFDISYDLHTGKFSMDSPCIVDLSNNTLWNGKTTMTLPTLWNMKSRVQDIPNKNVSKANNAEEYEQNVRAECNATIKNNLQNHLQESTKTGITKEKFIQTNLQRNTLVQKLQNIDPDLFPEKGKQIDAKINPEKFATVKTLYDTMRLHPEHVPDMIDQFTQLSSLITSPIARSKSEYLQNVFDNQDNLAQNQVMTDVDMSDSQSSELISMFSQQEWANMQTLNVNNLKTFVHTLQTDPHPDQSLMANLPPYAKAKFAKYINK